MLDVVFDKPAIANGLMRDVTIKSDKARLAMIDRPTPLPVVHRLRICLTVTVAMTTRLP